MLDSVRHGFWANTFTRSVAKAIIAAPDTSVPDADDTAKAILALRYLGRPDVDIGPLLATFEADEHFLTYPGERNSSFSTNCNVLMCLVMLEDPLLYTSQVIKTVKFLSDRIFTAQITDKWVRHGPLIVTLGKIRD